MIPQYASIWIVVLAVNAVPGEAVSPIAMAAMDAESQHVINLDFCAATIADTSPYPTGHNCLLVTINASDLVACHLTRGWQPPLRIVDLMVEFRCLTNGRMDVPVGGLAGALLWFGQPIAGAVGSAITPGQLASRLAAVARLFQAMRPTLDLGRALLRGRYLAAVANIEAAGIPIDHHVLDYLVGSWSAVQRGLVDIVDCDSRIYPGQTFNRSAFVDWLAQRAIIWPSTTSGQLDLGDEAFREMVRAHPELRPIKELRATLERFDPAALAVGNDGRNRTSLRPFSSSTGRNQPSAKASVLGTAA
jgi:DNA polymerase I